MKKTQDELDMPQRKPVLASGVGVEKFKNRVYGGLMNYQEAKKLNFFITSPCRWANEISGRPCFHGTSELVTP